MKGLLDAAKGLATDLGLRKDDPEDGASSGDGSHPPPAQPFTTAVNSALPVSGIIAGADPQKVEVIKGAVLKSSPVLATFMANCETMKKAFPNDETARMRAGLAMMGGNVDKATLLDEMKRTVSAALLHTRNGADQDRTRARTELVGPLEQELAATSEEIGRLQVQHAELGRLIAEKQGRVGTITGSISEADTRLQQQDAVVKASFTEVERFIAALTLSFSQL